MAEENKTNEPEGSGEIPSVQVGNGSGVPLLKQWDPTWADHPYNGRSISTSGCGPTCVAMLLRWYGKDVTPADTADLSTQMGCAVPGQGTSHSFMTNGPEYWGVTMTQLHSDEEVRTMLKSGFPVIASHASGMFTSGGHYIMYSKLIGDDQLIINDPAMPYGGGTCNNSSSGNGDDTKFSLKEVLADNRSYDGSLLAWGPTTPHDGVTPLMDKQSDTLHGADRASGSSRSGSANAESEHDGFKFIYHGKTVTIIKLPKGKTYCEPIYPDLVTVGDQTPKWALDATVKNMDANGVDNADLSKNESVGETA